MCGALPPTHLKKTWIISSCTHCCLVSWAMVPSLWPLIFCGLTCALAKAPCQAVRGPQASPTRTPGYLISWAMAPSLWPLAFSQALGHGPKAMASSPRPWPWLGSQADSERNWVMTPSPRQCPQAPGHGRGHGPWPWLGPQAYGQRKMSMGIGYGVWGIGYRV